jgi:hypothetical protein
VTPDVGVPIAASAAQVAAPLVDAALSPLVMIGAAQTAAIDKLVHLGVLNGNQREAAEMLPALAAAGFFGPPGAIVGALDYAAIRASRTCGGLSLANFGEALAVLHADERGVLKLGNWVSPQRWARDVANGVLKRHKSSGIGAGARSGMHGRPYAAAAQELDEMARARRAGRVEGLLDEVVDEFERIAEQWRQRAREINHPMK